jgi:hypothetical protein
MVVEVVVTIGVIVRKELSTLDTLLLHVEQIKYFGFSWPIILEEHIISIFRTEE